MAIWLALIVFCCRPAAATGVAALEARSAELEESAREASAALENSLRSLAAAKAFAAAAEPSWVDPKRTRAYCANNPWPLETVLDKARLYYMCRAVVSGDTAVCDEMGPNSRVSVFYKRSDCVRGWWNLRLARAIISKSPDLERICMDHEDFRSQFAEGDRSLVCKKLRGSDPKVLCEMLQRRYPDQFRHANFEDCVSENSVFWGVNTNCEAFAKTGFQFMEEQICAAGSRYRAVLAAGDSRKCEGSVLCRALLGQTQACGEYMAALRADVCRAAQPDTGPSPTDARLDLLVGEIESALAATARRPMALSEKAAAARLHGVMTRLQPVEPRVVITDILTLRIGALGDSVSRGEAVCEAIAKESKSCAVRRRLLRGLKARSEKVVAAFSSESGLSFDQTGFGELFTQ